MTLMAPPLTVGRVGECVVTVKQQALYRGLCNTQHVIGWNAVQNCAGTSLHGCETVREMFYLKKKKFSKSANKVLSVADGQ